VGPYQSLVVDLGSWIPLQEPHYDALVVGELGHPQSSDHVLKGEVQAVVWEGRGLIQYAVK
jgi:hypothetical protein